MGVYQTWQAAAHPDRGRVLGTAALEFFALGALLLVVAVGPLVVAWRRR
jgi:hypothetical protein